MRRWTIAAAVVSTVLGAAQFSEGADKPESLGDLTARIGRESSEAYDQSPYSALSRDYFSRFAFDPEAKTGPDETRIEKDWEIVYRPGLSPLGKRMAKHLADFLTERMQTPVALREIDAGAESDLKKSVYLLESSPAPAEKEGSFSVSVKEDSVLVTGGDSTGLRDGIVKLVEWMGMKQAPILAKESRAYSPRLEVRLGTVPSGGTQKDLVFMGYNAVFAGGGNLHSLSTSDAIPELEERKVPGSLAGTVAAVSEAQRYGLKAYAFFDTRQKYPKDHPVFKNHPDLRGALTWREDGEYVLCTEHPLVRQYLSESMEAVFKAAPGLAGGVIIIGGEGFYHCFMRPYGVEKGHTNCPRCEKLGAERVVANLCNTLAAAARKANPEAVIAAWPYSAEHVWSADKGQIGFIEKLEPGTGILTEIEKDEYVQKPEGVNKHLWDYSIDLIGPGKRAKDQIAACRKAGIPLFLKSEPELGFEAPRLPSIPCMDRWADRAEALASCGASGAFVFPAFRPCYGTVAAEIPKLFWWEPVPEREKTLLALAERVAGKEAAPHLREAWKHVSRAIDFSPEIPPYYTGPYYLGPMQPMCCDPAAELPEVFYGYYFFYAEIMDAEGVKKRPTFMTEARGDVPVFGRYYRQMEEQLAKAVAEIDVAGEKFSGTSRPAFDSEVSATRWFYRTARTHANFYESCQIRDRLVELSKQGALTPDEKAEFEEKMLRWRRILLDEKENCEASLPVIEADVRLDPYYGSDHSFSHGAEMIRKKLALLENEIGNYLPSLEAAIR